MSAPPPARYMADPSRSKRKTPLSGTINEFIASGRSALDTEAACSLLPSPGRTHYWSRRHAARPINPTKPTTRTGRLPGSGTRIIDRGAQLLGSVVLTTLRPLDQPQSSSLGAEHLLRVNRPTGFAGEKVHFEGMPSLRDW